MSTYNKQLLQTNKFAYIAKTTKRTIIFYDEKGVLKPFRVDKNGQRFYKEEQLNDFHAIQLLTRTGILLSEIQEKIKSGFSIAEIFSLEKFKLEEEINNIKYRFEKINYFYSNLDFEIDSKNIPIKKVKKFEIYYIVRTGDKNKKLEYFNELKSMFNFLPQNSIYINIYLDSENKIKRRMMIGVIKNKSAKINERGKEVLESETIPNYNTLFIEFSGNMDLLQIYREKLERFKKKSDFKKNPLIPYGVEIFKDTILNGNEDVNTHKYEIQIPVV